MRIWRTRSQSLQKQTKQTKAIQKEQNKKEKKNNNTQKKKLEKIKTMKSTQIFLEAVKQRVSVHPSTRYIHINVVIFHVLFLLFYINAKEAFSSLYICSFSSLSIQLACPLAAIR